MWFCAPTRAHVARKLQVVQQGRSCHGQRCDSHNNRPHGTDPTPGRCVEEISRVGGRAPAPAPVKRNHHFTPSDQRLELHLDDGGLKVCGHGRTARVRALHEQQPGWRRLSGRARMTHLPSQSSLRSPPLCSSTGRFWRCRATCLPAPTRAGRTRSAPFGAAFEQGSLLGAAGLRTMSDLAAVAAARSRTARTRVAKLAKLGAKPAFGSMRRPTPQCIRELLCT